MMELLPSGKTLVNLSLNFVHFMRHLYTYIYICIKVVERYTHTHEASLPEEINGNIFSFIRWIEFLKRKIWLEFLFSTTILPGLYCKLGEDIWEKYIAATPSPAALARWNGSCLFTRAPSKSRDLFKFEETRYGNPFPP